MNHGFLASTSTAVDDIAQLTAGLPSKFSVKRRDRPEISHPAKIPADAKFHQPILARKKASAHSEIPAAAYDLTAGRLSIPISAPSKPSAAVPVEKFSEADNLLAMQTQAKQKPDTQAG
jgi:hypothetical protein